MSASRWRVAARIVRRECTRHPWRTAIAALILIVPVLGAQGAAVTWAAAQARERHIERAERDGADIAMMRGYLSERGIQQLIGRPGMRLAVRAQVMTWVLGRQQAKNGSRPVAVKSTVRDGIAGSPRDRVLEGRTPRTGGEATVSERLAVEAGLRVGDRLELPELERSVDVVGIVRPSDAIHGLVVVVGRQEPGSALSRSWLYDAAARNHSNWYAMLLASSDSPEDVAALRHEVGAARSDFELDRTGQGVVAAIIAGVAGVIVVVASTTFIVGARRQMRSLGLLSANGATPADLHRAVLLQGAGVGLIAALAATTTTVVVVAAANHTGWGSRLAGVEGMTVPIPIWLVVPTATLAVLIGTLGAAVPAVQTGRLSTLAALAGRQPLAPLKLGLSALSAALMAAGTMLLVLGSDSGGGAVVSVIGALACIFGGIGLAPVLVATAGTLASRFGTAPRLAVRGLARTRTRTAAAVGAIAVVLAVPIAAATADSTSSRQDQDDRAGEVGQAWVYVDDAEPRSDHLVTQALEILGPDTWALRPLGQATMGNGPLMYLAEQPSSLDSATRPIADLLDQGRAVRVVHAREGPVPTVPSTIDVGGQRLPLSQIEISADDSTRGLLSLSSLSRSGRWQGTGAVLVPPEHAGTAPLQEPISLIRPNTPATAEGEALASLDPSRSPQAIDPRRGLPSPESAIVSNARPADDRRATILLLSSATMALVIAVLALTLALHAIEGRADAALLAVLGSPPRAQARQRALEAAVVVTLGLVLACAIGWLSAQGALRQGPQPGPPVLFPWETVLILAAAVITVAVVGTWVVSWISDVRRSRVRNLTLLT